MAMAPGNYIAHNHFTDLSRNGIFAFRNQGGNVVEYNHIHDAMQTTIDGACIHFATMNHLNAPNYILNNWLYDIWGYEQKPDGKPIRHLANGVFLDWDTSNTTVKDNWIYNAGGKPIKSHLGQLESSGSQDNKIVGNTHRAAFRRMSLGRRAQQPTALTWRSNRLTGSVVHYTDRNLVSFAGDWKQRTIDGFWGLFSFKLLEADKVTHAEINYDLPIGEDGTYQVSLLYLPNAK